MSTRSGSDPEGRKLRVTASDKPAQRLASAATPVPTRRSESTGEKIGYFIAMMTYPLVFAIFGSEIHLGLIAWRGNIPEFREMLMWGPVVGFGVGFLLGLLSAVMHGGVSHFGKPEPESYSCVHLVALDVGAGVCWGRPFRRPVGGMDQDRCSQLSPTAQDRCGDRLFGGGRYFAHCQSQLGATVERLRNLPGILLTFSPTYKVGHSCTDPRESKRRINVLFNDVKHEVIKSR